MRIGSHLSLPLVVGLAASCSFVEFERGPYAIRDLDVVYSEQEDLTFLSWRLRSDAKLDRVSFALWRDGDYVPIDLDEAPFPAAGRTCYTDFWCFQYQVPGRYEIPHDLASPLRSEHDSDGVFMGPKERYRVVEKTFDIDPIALGKNVEIDPRRFDWFDENSVPLRRDYQWQFSTWDGECRPPTNEWLLMQAPMDVDHAWTDRAVAGDGICFNARPWRLDDEDGVLRQARMVPSAETSYEAQEYAPHRQLAPIAWALMLDLEIPSEERCRRVKDFLIGKLEDEFNARGSNTRLGVYTPLHAETSEPLGGCEQAALRNYPFEQMLADTQAFAAEKAPTNTRTVWIFVNNVELPPPESVIEQLYYLGLLSAFGLGGLEGLGDAPFPEDVSEDDLDFLPPGLDPSELPDLYTWAIGSNLFMQLAPWNQATGWRPIEDRTFAADLKSVVKTTVPFASMIHDDATEVEIRLPTGVPSRPHYFRVCDAAPFALTSLGTVSGNPSSGPGAVVPWPETDDDHPYYTVTIPPQYLVPFIEYVPRTVEIVAEVCTAFCSGPFRTRGGEDHPSWLSSPVCQWSP